MRFTVIYYNAKHDIRQTIKHTVQDIYNKTKRNRVSICLYRNHCIMSLASINDYRQTFSVLLGYCCKEILVFIESQSLCSCTAKFIVKVTNRFNLDSLDSKIIKPVRNI